MKADRLYVFAFKLLIYQKHCPSVNSDQADKIIRSEDDFCQETYGYLSLFTFRPERVPPYIRPKPWVI